MDDLQSRASNIKLIILDVDGVLTSGEIIIDDTAKEAKAFHVRDGQGIKLLQSAGIKVAIITGRRSEVVAVRAKELEIEYLFQGCNNKLEAYERLKAVTGLTDREIACVGDDINEIPLFKRSGLAVAVADAVDELKRHSHFITTKAGGKGAVREICELILKAQGKWGQVIDAYLQA